MFITHAPACAHTHTRTHTHTHTCTQIHAHARTHTHAHMHTSTQIHSHAHAHTHAHARTHAHTHTHTHAHKHTHRRAYFAPIDLTALLRDHLLASRTPTAHVPTHDIIWQTVLLTPDPRRLRRSDCHLLKWLTQKLTYSPPKEEPHPAPLHTLSLTSSPLHGGGVASESQRIQIAVKCFCPGAMKADVAEDGVRRALLGTSAVMVYVPTPQEGESPEVIHDPSPPLSLT